MATDVRLDIAPYDFAAAVRLRGRSASRTPSPRCSSAAASPIPGPRARFLAARRRAPARRVRRPARGGGGHRSATSSAASRITVHGDYDVDGVCSTAILVRALRTLGARRRLVPAQPHRRRLRARRRRRSSGWPPAGPSCWSPPTARSPRSRRSRRRARPGWTSWSPTTTRRAPTAGCRTRRSSTRASAATRARTCAPPGVAYKLAQALLEAAGLDPAAADADLDLVALATVADVVPLEGENRGLVRAGLRALARTRKPGLRALMEVVARGPERGGRRRRSASGSRRGSTPPGRLQRADAGLELLLTDRRRARAARSPRSSTR